MPNDGGNLIFNDEERERFLLKEPSAQKYIKPFISAREFLNNENRWCLWLKDISPIELKNLPEVVKQILKVKEHRQKSKRNSTNKLADCAYLFAEIRQPNADYLLIPRHSSEQRKYIPIAFLSSNIIAGDSCCTIENANLYHFGVLTSSIHMAWVKQICGRIKSDFRYSNNLVYNNYPWPESPSVQDKMKVEETVQQLLNIREKYSNIPLSVLYNPLLMPKDLFDIHSEVDKAVDKCYRKRPFNNDLSRLEYLFCLYTYYLNHNGSTVFKIP